MQGVTEFLPVSSSAHLKPCRGSSKSASGNVDKLDYDVMVHFGTAFALLSIYTGKIVQMCPEDLRKVTESRSLRDSMVMKIALGTVPAVVFGLLFKDLIEYYVRTPLVSVFSLVVVSIFMILAERLHLGEHKITYTFALAIGLAQAVALVPGVSRSGITITMGIMLGLRRREAVDFAFLLSIPVVIGVALLEMHHMPLFEGDESTVFAAGTFSAFIAGLASLTFLIQLPEETHPRRVRLLPRGPCRPHNGLYRYQVVTCRRCFCLCPLCQPGDVVCDLGVRTQH